MTRGKGKVLSRESKEKRVNFLQKCFTCNNVLECIKNNESTFYSGNDANPCDGYEEYKSRLLRGGKLCQGGE
jgi:hypothetical protein